MPPLYQNNTVLKTLSIRYFSSRKSLPSIDLRQCITNTTQNNVKNSIISLDNQTLSIKPRTDKINSYFHSNITNNHQITLHKPSPSTYNIISYQNLSSIRHAMPSLLKKKKSKKT